MATSPPYTSQAEVVALAQNVLKASGLQDQVNGLTSGFENIYPTSTPSGTIKVGNVSQAGTYANFSGVVVTSADLLGNFVQLRKNASGVWEKYLIPIPSNWADAIAALSADLMQTNPKTQYKHPNGDTEYVGNASYSANAMGWYSPVQSAAYNVTSIQFKAGVATGSATVYIKVYAATNLTGNPTTGDTLLAELTRTFDSNIDNFRTITFDTPIIVPASKYLKVLLSTQSAVKIAIKTWNNNTPGNRLTFIYTTSTVENSGIFNTSFIQSSAPGFLAVPMIVTMRYPFVYATELDTRLATIDASIATLNAFVVNAPTVYATKDYLQTAADQVTSTSANGDSEYVGNSAYTDFGVAQYTAPQSAAWVFNQLSLKMARETSGVVYIKIYTTSGSLYAKPDTNWTLLVPEFQQMWNTDVDTFKVLSFDTLYTVPAGSRLVVCVSTKSSTKVIVKRWNANAANRVNFIFTSSTNYTTIFNENWTQSSFPDFGAPPILARLLFPLVKRSTYDAKIAEILALIGAPFAPRITIPSTIYATVGVQFNLYYDALVLATDKGLTGPIGCTVEIYSNKGQSFDRNWTITPVTADIGTHSLTVKVYNSAHTKIAEQTVSLIITAATAPPYVKNVVMIGDSTLNNGPVTTTVIENFNALGGGGVNVPTFWGTRGTGAARHEGRGGWTFNNYASAGPAGTYYVFAVAGVTSSALGAIYTNNGSSFTIAELSLSGGSGYVRATRTAGTNAPTASGTLTKASGSGDDTLAFSSTTTETGNPLWNAATSALDIANYRTAVLGMGSSVKFDLVTIRLGINESFGDILNETNRLAVIEDAKKIINAFIVDSAITKIVIALPTTSGNTKGGWGTNYGATGFREAYMANIWRLRELILTTFGNGAFNANVYVGPTGIAVDRFYGYYRENRSVGTRYTEIESIHGNAVHPGTEGYKQLADAEFPIMQKMLL